MFVKTAFLRRRLLELAGLVVSVNLALAGEPEAARQLDAARKSELKNLVLQDCGSCHGMTLKGGLGSPLLPERLAELEATAISAIVLDGIPGTPMPPWRGLLSDADADWIARALKSGEFK